MRLNCQSAFDVLIVPQIQNWDEQQQQQQDSLSRSKRPRPFLSIFFFWLEKKKIISTSIKNSLFFKKRKSPCAAEYFLPVNPSSFVPNLFLFCFLSFLPVHQNHKLNVYSEMNKNGNPNSVELLRERERKRESYYISIANIAKSFFSYAGALIWLWQ
jgi:hypothetical protein